MAERSRAERKSTTARIRHRHRTAQPHHSAPRPLRPREKSRDFTKLNLARHYRLLDRPSLEVLLQTIFRRGVLGVARGSRGWSKSGR